MTGTARFTALLLAVLSAVFAATAARADGEAGLVIQHGDGSVDTYCVAFSGDSITGKDLLKRVNIPTEDYGGLVCAIGTNPAEGCFGASSFDSCTCKYSGSGTYWAYFTASYGKSWVYSALGFTQAKAKDGDLQAWRWGRGGANSAPVPPTITFESVCGHAPRGGAAQATAEPVPSVTATLSTTPTQSGSAVPAPPPQLTAVVTLPATTPSNVPANASTPIDTTTVTITSHGTATATPPPAASSSASGGNPDGTSSLVAFGVVAAGLVAAIGGALLWRSRHGS
ncbi:MAG: hypothetical protein C0506_09100 [Anaerolinea sp.]|nr:hypothetical protein [Anaerolinea sp.]